MRRGSVALFLVILTPVVILAGSMAFLAWHYTPEGHDRAAWIKWCLAVNPIFIVLMFALGFALSWLVRAITKVDIPAGTIASVLGVLVAYSVRSGDLGLAFKLIPGTALLSGPVLAVVFLPILAIRSRRRALVIPSTPTAADFRCSPKGRP